MDKDIKKFVALQQALVEEQATLQARLKQINNALSETPVLAATTAAKKSRPGKAGRKAKRTMSPEARARIAAAQRRRWAKAKSKKSAKK